MDTAEIQQDSFILKKKHLVIQISKVAAQFKLDAKGKKDYFIIHVIYNIA